jgi:hypothetical protein
MQNGTRHTGRLAARHATRSRATGLLAPRVSNRPLGRLEIVSNLQKTGNVDEF